MQALYPGGTPELTSDLLENLLFMTTFCVRLLIKFSIHPEIEPVFPQKLIVIIIIIILIIFRNRHSY